MKINSVRSRAAAAFVTGMALLGSGAAVTTTVPAQSAAPTDDCAAPFPVAELIDGDAVTGLTVSDGTTPEGFTGEVLGVIDDGIAPGLDMVMARLDSSEISRVGIWQGMSGSPVYADDGRLIGAVAYGLAWGPSPVAGITPFEDMDDYLSAPAPARIKVSDRNARAIAADSGVTRAQAEQGFRQLPMPMAYSGISKSRLRQAKKKGPDHLSLRGAVAMGAASSAAAADPDTLVAGGNLGAAISYGDVTAGGVGTVTSVCQGRLVGFGHPMAFTGKTTFGMMPAEAVYVQEDPVGPGFKVANMGLPAGTIDQDRLTGISGDLGALPPEADVSSTVSYENRNRTGVSHSLVQAFNADVTFMQILANHDRVVDAIQPGSEVAAYSVTGTDRQGRPFDIAFDDRYTSEWDISFESIFEIADVVWMLSRMQGVTVDAVTADAEVSDATATWRLRKLEQRRRGEWVKLGRRQPAMTRSGGVLRLRTTLVEADRVRTVRFRLDVPKDARRRGFLQVEGGGSIWDSAIYQAETPAQLQDAVGTRVRNDEVQASLRFSRRGSQVSAVSRPQSLVVRGGKWAEVLVRR